MPFLLLVKEESNKHFNSVKFTYEQRNLMIQNDFDYSTEIIFFHSCITTPPKDWVLRDSKNIILHRYLTIKRLILSTYMNPLIEQHPKSYEVFSSYLIQSIV